ncbi:adenylate kinase family protein [Halomarina ordinaria]|uniref:Putative adenylate kinase n=1 Tax=Halomarina ordinaria TaxID=3033939 RepID=A0ABD5U5K7_9EURY|nr:adenylate kinase family protein [Halomarina sp. PSRA2]
MRVAVTGTPGTGKTTATDRLADAWDGAEELRVVHLNDVIREEGFHDGADPDRGSLYADLDALAGWLDERADADVELVDSHLAHHLDADRVVVVRCRPDELKRRLTDRGETPAKARENAEAEALDVVLAEAVERHGFDAVYEVDATDRSPDDVADAVAAVVRGEREPSAGTVDFAGYL